jgi:hypothetical protein
LAGIFEAAAAAGVAAAGADEAGALGLGKEVAEPEPPLEVE